MLSSDSRVSCETDFCAECPLKGKCDHTCGLPCPDGAARWPPGQPFLMCFDATCDAAPILEQRGAMVLKGCAAGAPLGAVCRLGCTTGFENTADEDVVSSCDRLIV